MSFIQNIFGGLLAGRASSALIDFVTPEIPGAPEQGDQLKSGGLKANAPKQGQPVRVLFGEYNFFPDPIVQARPRFIDERTQETLHFFSLFQGEGEVNQTDIRIGDTPIPSFGTDASATVYEPGANAGGDERSECWYLSPSVGGTAGGTAGLSLDSTTPTGSSVVADSVTASGDSITINGDADEISIPDSWAVDTVITVQIPKDATIASALGYNTFTGDWQDVEPFVGMVVTVSVPGRDIPLVVNAYTDNGGTNDVLQFEDDDGGAFDDLASGNYRVAIGYRGHNYKIATKGTLSLNVDRLTDLGVVDSGWGGWDNTTVTDFEVSSDEAGDTSWLGWFFAVPEGETTGLLEYDVYFPQGLIAYDRDDGDKHTRTVTVELEWYDDTTAQGATVQHVISNKTPDSIGYTYQLVLPSQMRPRVRMRRVGAGGDTRYKTNIDAVQWYRLKAKLPYRPTSYDGVTTMAVTVRSGDRIAAATNNQINVTATAKYNGVTDRRISTAIYRIAALAGVPLSQINTDQIDALEADYWTPRGEAYDHVIAEDITAGDAMATALAAGMSELSAPNGLISAVREGVKTETGNITPDMMTEGGELETSCTISTDDIYGGVDVSFIDRNTWTEQTVECRLDGVAATLIESITVDGVTDKTRAWRIGMRRLRQHQSRPMTYTCQTEMMARNYSKFDRVRLSEDIPGVAQSSRIIGYSESGGVATLTVDSKLDWSGLASPRVVIRDHSGGSTGIITPTRVTDNVLVISQSALGFIPDTSLNIQPAALILCDSTQVAYDCILTSVKPNPDLTTDIEAREYSDSYYADDDSEPPE